MTSKQIHSPQQAGFTLIELSIVLVIIGLIAGGILVGQDMIKAAEVRSAVKQIESYNSAMNTFRDKYRYLPGDLSRAAAAQFGFTTRAGTVGAGDGNALLQAGATTANQQYLGNETALVWRDLNQAGMIDGSFATATDAMVAAANPDALKAFLPESKIGKGNLITVYALQGQNFYHIAGFTAAAAGALTESDALSPQEAYNIDAKIDDGRPLVGSVRAVSNETTQAAVATAAAGVCVVAGAATTDPALYNTGQGATGATAVDDASTWANSPACQLRLRFN